MQLLDYLTAKKQIYLPSYAWVLQKKTTSEIDELIAIALRQDLVLLDFETNSDIENPKPLSHAALIKKFIDKKYPELTKKRFTEPISTKEKNEKKKTGKPRSKQEQKKEDITLTDEQQLFLNF